MTALSFVTLTSYHYAKVVDWLTGLIADLKGAAVKILLRVAKCTFGFRKWEDKIALSQFEEACGLTRQSVTDTIQDLLTLKLLRRAKAGNGFRYALNLPTDLFVEKAPVLVDNPPSVVHNSQEGCSFFTQNSGTSPQNGEQMVGKLDPQINNVTEGNGWNTKFVEILNALSDINATAPCTTYALRNLPRWVKRALSLGMGWGDVWALWRACQRVGRNPLALFLHRLQDDGTPPVGEPPPVKQEMDTRAYWRLAMQEGN
jgi:hypothetical protein